MPRISTPLPSREVEPPRTGDAPLCADLYCGDGGAGEGYRRAGFDVLGFDQEEHPYPPGEFHQADAVAVLRTLVDTGELFGRPIPFVHASPPCHDFTDLASQSGLDGTAWLLFETRRLLQQWAAKWGGVYVIENVERAPLINPLTLCGSEFGLGARCRDGRWRYLKRHRKFESNVWLMGAGGCRHSGQPVGVYGTGGGGQMTRGYKGHPEEAREAMGIDWMSREDIAQAIPPAMTEFIGAQILDQLGAVAA